MSIYGSESRGAELRVAHFPRACGTVPCAVDLGHECEQVIMRLSQRAAQGLNWLQQIEAEGVSWSCGYSK